MALPLCKLQEKGTLSETKKTLGWLINTRKLSMALSITKGIKWKDIISKMIKIEHSLAKKVE